jgi:AbrB family looped-hinge helix DNA binding protein
MSGRRRKVRLRVGAGGRLVIPKSFREAIGLSPGSDAVLEFRDGALVISNPGQMDPRFLEALRNWREAERLRDWRLIRMGTYEEKLETELEVGPEGEVVIPRRFREAIQISAGSEVVLERGDDRLIIRNPEFKFDPRFWEAVQNWRMARRMRDWRLLRRRAWLDEEEEGTEWYYDEEG